MSVIRTVFLATCLIAGSCGQANSGDAKPNAAPVTTQPIINATPAQSEQRDVTASCGGGVTGGGGGVTVRSDHHIITWRRMMAGSPRTETDLGADDAFFTDIHRNLQTAGFANINYNAPADMTCSLTAGGHSVSWQPGDPNAPASVLTIHHLLMSAGG
jgi:hypothetical protein